MASNVTLSTGTDPNGTAPTATLKVPAAYTYRVATETDVGSEYINATTIARNGTKN